MFNVDSSCWCHRLQFPLTSLFLSPVSLDRPRRSFLNRVCILKLSHFQSTVMLESVDMVVRYCRWEAFYDLMIKSQGFLVGLSMAFNLQESLLPFIFISPM